MLTLWNDTETRTSVEDFLIRTCTEGSPDYLKPEERIATFDNDGTLWCEYPLQIQLMFSMDRLKEISKVDESVKDTQPLKAFLEKDLETLKTYSKKELFEFIFRTNAGESLEEYQRLVKEWFDNSKHPKLDKPCYDLSFRPMVEMLEHLRSHGFKTFIVSGGGIDFMRAISDRMYGIPTDQVIGSSIKRKLNWNGVKPAIERLSELNSFDDRDEKPVNIDLHIGRRPAIAFGNSDGDLAMLRYCNLGGSKSLSLIVHHDDAEREFAYDRDFKLSPLNEALDIADAEGIKIISMKNDWKTVF